MASFTKVKSLIKPLEKQIEGIKKHFPKLEEVEGVLLTGSCARGEATYRSDIDLVVVLKSPPLHYSRVRKIREDLENYFEGEGHLTLLSTPLEVQFTIVLSNVFSTKEPGMRDALLGAKIVSDPRKILRKKIA